MLQEAAKNLIEAGRDEEKIRKRFDAIRTHFAEYEVTGFESLIELMTCDPKDRHVLAAAVVGGANQIVTANIKDFPNDAVVPYNIEIVTPDEFLLNVADMYPRIVLEVVQEQAAALRSPPMGVDEVLNAISKCGAPEYAQNILNMLRAA